MDKKLAMLRDADPATLLQPWRTVRDAISDLPDPEKRPNAELVQAHRFQPGARTYPGHTGSPRPSALLARQLPLANFDNRLPVRRSIPR